MNQKYTIIELTFKIFYTTML